MPAPSPFDVLAAELGSVAGRIEREAGLRITAALAELRQFDAERELRFTRLEQQVADRLATVKDGKDGNAAEPLTDEQIATQLAVYVAANPPAPGQDGEDGNDGNNATDEQVATQVAAYLAANPPQPGKDGNDGIGIDDITAEQQDGKLLVLAFQRGDVTDIFEIELPEGRAGKDAEPAEPGKDGKDGKLVAVKDWAAGVHYEGDVRYHAGATYQARCDTANEPPDDDWQALAVAGRDGNDGRSFRVRETWAEDAEYLALDVVALNGAGFVARRDNPGPCPGAGWQMIAAQGKGGKPGDPGKSIKGDRGDAGPPVVAMNINGEGVITVTNGDGSTVDVDLYPLLSKIDR